MSREQVTGEVIETYQYPSRGEGVMLPRMVRVSNPDLREGTYKLVRVDE